MTDQYETSDMSPTSVAVAATSEENHNNYFPPKPPPLPPRENYPHSVVTDTARSSRPTTPQQRAQTCCREMGQVLFVCFFSETFSGDYRAATPLRRVSLLLGKIVSSTTAILLMLLLYTFFGAAVFVKLEARNELEKISGMLQTRNLTLEMMRTLGMANLTHEEWISQATDALLSYSKVIEEAKQFGYSSSNHHISPNWNLKNSFHFCLTIYTTIGYGYLTPTTSGGRLFCIFYAIFGIPLFLVCMSSVTRSLTRSIKTIWIYTLHRIHYRFPKCRTCWQKMNQLKTKTCPDSVSRESTMSARGPDYYDFLSIYLRMEDAPSTSFPISVICVFIYLMIGSGVFMAIESWSLVDAIYFVFVTLSTIGFGDIHLKKDTGDNVFNTFYIFLGMILLTTLLTAISDGMEYSVRRAKANCAQSSVEDVKLRTASRNNSPPSPILPPSSAAIEREF